MDRSVVREQEETILRLQRFSSIHSYLYLLSTNEEKLDVDIEDENSIRMILADKLYGRRVA